MNEPWPSAHAVCRGPCRPQPRLNAHDLERRVHARRRWPQASRRQLGFRSHGVLPGGASREDAHGSQCHLHHVVPLGAELLALGVKRSKLLLVPRLLLLQAPGQTSADAAHAELEVREEGRHLAPPEVEGNIAIDGAALFGCHLFVRRHRGSDILS